MMYELAKAMMAERDAELEESVRTEALLSYEECAECAAEHGSHLRSRGFSWLSRRTRSAA